MVSEVAVFAGVICEIYDAAVDPRLWPKALEACCAFLDAFQSNLFWHDAATTKAGEIYEFNTDPRFSKLYVEKYVTLNPIFPAAAFMKTGQVANATDLVPRDEFERTRFFAEWVKPQGIVRTFGVMLENEALRGAFASFQWDHEIDDVDARRRLTLLVPHLQRAVAIGRLFADQTSEKMAFEDTLDRIGDGVFLVGAGGKIVFANASGQAMIDEGFLLRAPSGILHASASAPDHLLHDSLRSTGGEIRPVGRDGVTIILQDGARQRWIANVLPLGDGVRRRAAGHQDAVAAVFVRQSTRADPAPLETLAAAHKLTASEIRVVEATMRINGLDAMADALGVSKATVKTHLNRVFRKCGVKNQGELIKLVAGIGNQD